MATTKPKATSKREPDPAPEAEPIATKKKKSWLLILAVVIVLLGGIGAAAWYFWPEQDPVVPKKPETGKTAVAAKVAPSKPRTFVPLEPFTVNLQREDSQALYLQIGLSLKLTDEKLVDPIKLAMPEIRSRILVLLMGKTASELGTPEGKKVLAEQLAREVILSAPGVVTAPALEAVLFTSFLIQ